MRRADKEPVAWRARWLVRSGLALGVYLGLVAGAVSPASASPGDLDQSFGLGGVVDERVRPTSLGAGEASDDVLVQADGKVLVGGSMSDATGSSVAVARYLADGRLDPAFGGDDGVTTVDLGGDFERVSRLVVDGAGRIVVGAVRHDDFTNLLHGYVVRLLADGSLDSSFGDGGVVALDFDLNGWVGDLTLGAGNRILIAATAWRTSNNQDLAAVRLLPDGAPDTSFSGDGYHLIDVESGSYDGGSAIAELDDGRVVLGGYSDSLGSFEDFVVVRLSSTGAPDNTFGGGDGLVGVPGTGFTSNVHVYDDARVMVTGTAGMGGFAASRLLANGAPDPSFGGDGSVSATELGWDWDKVISAAQSRLAPDGSVLIAGGATTDPLMTSEDPASLAVAKLTGTGQVDTAFGDGDGQVMVSPPDGGEAGESSRPGASGLALDASGRIYLSGEESLMAFRLLPDGALDDSFDGDGRATAPPGNVVITDPAAAAAAPGGAVLVAVSGVVHERDERSDGLGVVRYEEDGDIDRRYGGGDGLAFARLREDYGDPRFGGADVAASALVVAPDGAVYVGGTLSSHDGADWDRDFLVVRFTPDGDLDRSFSGDGRIEIGFDDGYPRTNQPDDRLGGLALSDNGQLVAAGASMDRLAVARLDTSGEYDGSLAGDGRVVDDGFESYDSGPVGVDSSGRITYAASVEVPGGLDVGVIRLNPNGSRDRTYGGGDGLATAGMADDQRVATLTTTPAGGALVGGRSGEDLMLAKLSPSGDLEPTFGTGGFVVDDLAGGLREQVSGVALQPSGEIVAAGSIGNGLISVPSDYLIARYRQNGVIDTAFGGGDGWRSFDFTGAEDEVTGLALDGDRAVLAGAPDLGSGRAQIGLVAFELGNTSRPSRSADTVIRDGPDGPDNDPTPRFELTGPAGSSFECRISPAPFAPCPANYVSAPVADGTYAFEAQYVLAGGATDSTPAARPFTVDTSRPDTSIVSAEEDPESNDRIRFEFSSTEEDVEYECKLGQLAFRDCGGPDATHSINLGNGDYVLRVRAIDEAGNADATPAARPFQLSGPFTYISRGPAGVITSRAAEFGFSATPFTGQFECRIDSDPFGGCIGSGNSHVLQNLAEGPHVFEVRAYDGGIADVTPARRSFSVDTIAPETGIDPGSPPVGDRTPTLTFSSNDPAAVYECSVDGEPFALCSGPGLSHTVEPPLAHGPHTLAVRARDLAGNGDSTPATRQFSVDALPPDTSILSGPTGVLTQPIASFSFAASEPGVVFSCRLDDSPAADCSSPHEIRIDALGWHVFRVTASDTAGNTDPTPATHYLYRAAPAATGAPDTKITRAPRSPSRGRRASFEFAASAPAATFACTLDRTQPVPCASPFRTPRLRPGLHKFSVAAIGPAGVLDATPATHTWKLKRRRGK